MENDNYYELLQISLHVTSWDTVCHDVGVSHIQT